MLHNYKITYLNNRVSEGRIHEPHIIDFIKWCFENAELENTKLKEINIIFNHAQDKQ